MNYRYDFTTGFSSTSLHFDEEDAGFGEGGGMSFSYVVEILVCGNGNHGKIW